MTLPISRRSALKGVAAGMLGASAAARSAGAVTPKSPRPEFFVQFVLPRGVTLATAPQPLDDRVRLREAPARKLAAIRYSGFWSQANYDEHLGKLQATLRTAGLAWSGEPVYARYNAPFTPWFMRRNEIWLSVP